MNTLHAAICCGISAAVCMMGAGLLLYMLIERRIVRKITQKFNAFLLPPKEGEASQFGLMIDGAAQVLSSRLIATLSASLRGTASGEIRKAAADAAASNPLASILGPVLGKKTAGLLNLAGIFKSGNNHQEATGPQVNSPFSH